MQKVWIEIFSPTENDKGKYTLEMFDGQETHSRSLDLSGQGELQKRNLPEIKRHMWFWHLSSPVAFADALLEHHRLK